jgi:hypothetical protein
LLTDNASWLPNGVMFHDTLHRVSTIRFKLF